LAFQGPEILESFAAAEEPLVTLTKKEKQQAKKEAFQQRTKAIVLVCMLQLTILTQV
jgi:hypothetical protein